MNGCAIIKLYYECGPCILRQVKEVIDLSCDEEYLKFELMQKCLIHISNNFNNDSQPNKIATEVNQYIKNKTGCEDAYFKQKEITASTQIRLSALKYSS